MSVPSADSGLHGRIGERAAARYLFFRFYRILERNWFFHRKEIDIIARRGHTLVICEVKTRTRTDDAPSPYGSPSSAVNAAKEQNLLQAARAYVHASGWKKHVRMDVIEVYLSPAAPGKVPRVRRIVHIKNAFTA